MQCNVVEKSLYFRKTCSHPSSPLLYLVSELVAAMRVTSLERSRPKRQACVPVGSSNYSNYVTVILYGAVNRNCFFYILNS
jgi:hypothetical protein